MLEVLFQRDVIAFTKIGSIDKECNFSIPSSLNCFKAFIT